MLSFNGENKPIYKKLMKRKQNMYVNSLSSRNYTYFYVNVNSFLEIC